MIFRHSYVKYGEAYFLIRAWKLPETVQPVMALSKFQLLLNNLSNELNERNLQSLIHICGDLIPGGQRDNIRNGWQVFTILLHRDAIGDTPQKLQLLLQIVRELKPKRKDLVSMVKRYIEENYEEAEIILNDIESSGEFSFQSSRPPTPTLVEDSGCLFRTSCFNCSCTRCCCNCCCCCAFLAIFFLLLTVTSVLVWYTRIFPEVQHYRKTHPHHQYVGPLVTFVFGFTAVSFLCMSVGYYCFQRHRGVASHTLLSDVDDKTSNQVIHDNSYSPSVSTRTSGTFPRKMRRSTSSGRVTASSSFASIANSYPAPILPSNLEANGSLRQHNAFITEYEEDVSTADGCHASLGDTESLNQQTV